jgi:hypothetical protein
MEAYSQVHAPQELTEEQVWEEVETWVNTLIEEGHDLSDYTWEEMYEAYLEEQGGTRGGGERATSQQVGAINRGLSSFGQSIGQSMAAANKVPTSSGSRNVRGGGSRPATTAAKPAATTPAAKPATTPVAKPAATTPAAKPAATTPAAKPAATTPAAKPAATTAAKPTTPTKPAGSAMDQWAKANPKLAAAKAERDRTRGTSATTNPLMKDMKSRLPAPKSPAPPKGVNLASDVDLFDIVKGYLLDEGYAESEDAAMVIMVNMSEGWKESILESCGVELELDESQHARENPEEYERSSEAKEGRRKRSGINDPDTGINSDKFKAFMAQQMGGKKKKG